MVVKSFRNLISLALMAFPSYNDIGKAAKGVKIGGNKDIFVTFPSYNDIGKANVRPEPKTGTPEIRNLPETEMIGDEAKGYLKREETCYFEEMV